MAVLALEKNARENEAISDRQGAQAAIPGRHCGRTARDAPKTAHSMKFLEKLGEFCAKLSKETIGDG